MSHVCWRTVANLFQDELEAGSIFLLTNSLGFSPEHYDVLIVAMTPRMDCPLITADEVMHEQKQCAPRD